MLRNSAPKVWHFCSKRAIAKQRVPALSAPTSPACSAQRVFLRLSAALEEELLNNVIGSQAFTRSKVKKLQLGRLWPSRGTSQLPWAQNGSTTGLGTGAGEGMPPQSPPPQKPLFCKGGPAFSSCITHRVTTRHPLQGPPAEMPRIHLQACFPPLDAGPMDADSWRHARYPAPSYTLPSSPKPAEPFLQPHGTPFPTPIIKVIRVHCTKFGSYTKVAFSLP